MQIECIRQLILTALPDCEVTIHSDDNVHFDATIISELFEDLSLVKRQQLVYGAISKELKSGEIHAFSMKTLTPEEKEEVE